MNLVDLAEGKQPQAGRLASNAIGWVALENYDDTPQLVLHPHKPFYFDHRFMKIFRDLITNLEEFQNPRILRPLEFIEDETGSLSLGRGRIQSLAALLRSHPELLADETWKERFLDDLMEAVDYLHRRGYCALDLSPQSILVTEDQDHRIRLMPPCSPFLPLRDILWTRPSDYLAPELTNHETPNDDDQAPAIDRPADIYAVARIIKLFYHYGDIPYRYRQAVHHALKTDPTRRPQTIGEMQRMMQASHKRGRIAYIVGSVAAVLLVAGLFLFWPGNNQPTPQDYIEPVLEETGDTANLDKTMDDVEKFLRDTTYMKNDTAYSLSDETKAEQREMMKKAEEVFARQFTIQAYPIIKRIYENQLINGDQKAFQENANRVSHELQALSDRLAKQYQVDPTTANRICSPIADQLSEKCLREMREQK